MCARGSEPEREDWEDEVQRGSMCYICWMMGHFARDCRRRGKGKEKGGDGGKKYAKGKGTLTNGTGKKGSVTLGGFQGRIFRRTYMLGYQGQCRKCGKVGHRSPECRRRVVYVDEEDADSRKSGGQPPSEEDGLVARGAVSSVGQVKIDVMNYV